MASNLDRYKKDLESLIVKGSNLYNAIQAECFPEQFEEMLKRDYGNKSKEFRKTIPSFVDTYQIWYSEAKMLVKQLLPDRIVDFAAFYEKPKSRKNITY